MTSISTTNNKSFLQTFSNNITSIFKKSSSNPEDVILKELADIYYSGEYLSRYINPDTLVGKKGLGIYKQMMNDEQVKGSLTLKKFAVLGPGWKIKQGSETAKSVELKDFIENAFNSIEGSITDLLFELMSALTYGYSLAEINWKLIAEGKYTGKIGIKNIKCKDPRLFYFDVDEFGNLLPDGIVLSNNYSAIEKRLPINKFLLWSYQKEFSNWYGESDLRAAYRPWWSKANHIKFLNIYLERFGIPFAILKYRQTRGGSTSKYKDFLDNLQGKSSILLPMDDYELDFADVPGRGEARFLGAIEYCDRAISRSILIPDRLVAAGVTGAFSQAAIHYDVFLWVLQSIRTSIEDTIMEEQLIKPLIEMNFGNYTLEELPKFVFNPLSDKEKRELALLFIDAVNKGVLSPVMKDQNYLRETLGMASLDEEDIKEILAKTPPTKKEQPKKKGLPEEEEDKEEDEEEPLEVKEKEKFAHYKKELLKAFTEQKETIIKFLLEKLENKDMKLSFIRSGIDLKYSKELIGDIQNIILTFSSNVNFDPSSDFILVQAELFLKSVKDLLVSEIKRKFLRKIKNNLNTINELSKEDISSIVEEVYNTVIFKDVDKLLKTLSL